MIPPEERRHIDEGPRRGELAGGVGLVELVVTGRDVRRVLVRAREVLASVLDQTGVDWPDTEQWRCTLPSWFVAACAPERSAQETQEWLARWRGLSPNERARVEREAPWSLAEWLHWMQPENRAWFWWHADYDNDRLARVQVEVDGRPVPLGALEWLLRASGAVEVQE